MGGSASPRISRCAKKSFVEYAGEDGAHPQKEGVKAGERDEFLRAAWRVMVTEEIDARDFVFVDECGAHASLAPVYGHMVSSGQLGELRKVIVEYNQGWLARNTEGGGAKQAEWRTDPARSGIAGAIGDIGSHAENLVSTITGLEISEICARRAC